MGELIDLELFELELLVLGAELLILRCELGDERGSQIAQLLRAQLCQSSRGKSMDLDPATVDVANSIARAFFLQHADLRVFVQTLPRQPHDERLQLVARRAPCVGQDACSVG